MNKLSSIALVALSVSFAAVAAEPPTAPIKQAAAPAATAVTPQKTAGLTQQDKMRECNKQATGKKGAERKTFMKDCLSKKA